MKLDKNIILRYCNQYNKQTNRDLKKDIIDTLYPGPRYDIEKWLKVCSKHFDIPISIMQSKKSAGTIQDAKDWYYYMSSINGAKDYDIGVMVGKERSTVAQNRKKHYSKMLKDKKLREIELKLVSLYHEM